MHRRTSAYAELGTSALSVEACDVSEPMPLAPKRPLSWRTLAISAGVGDACFLVILAGIRGDVYAAGFAALILVALGLLALGRATAGQVLLVLLFAEVSARMAPSVASNAVHGDLKMGTAMPLGLAAISLFGLWVTCMSLLRRPGPADGRWPVIALIGTLMSSVLLLSGLSLGLRPSDASEAPGLRLSMDALAFSVTEVGTAAGQVRIRLENDDLTWHTFTIDALGVDVRLPVGAQRDASFNAPPGTYSFVCRVPGHAAMRGMLRVD